MVDHLVYIDPFCASVDKIITKNSHYSQMIQ